MLSFIWRIPGRGWVMDYLILKSLKNLAIALDLVISQIILPRASEQLNRLSILREQLLGVFDVDGQFPRSYAFIMAVG